MPINASPHYNRAEEEYLQTETTEQKIRALKKMISLAPSHKGAENLRKQLSRRLARLKYVGEKESKKAKGGKEGIKKADMQAVIVGMPNAGKSSLFKALTNQETKISEQPYTTNESKPGTLNFEDVNIQTIDSAPFPNTDKSIINSTDTLLIVLDSLERLKQTAEFIKNSNAKKIFVYSKSDLLSETEKRKLSDNLKSKKLNFVLFSSKTHENIEELKKKLFDSFPIIRIYTKEPKKASTKVPLILKQDSTVKNVAEKILKGMSKKIKKARIWGPSSKFGGQVVGIDHILKDRDIVEFHTS